MKEALTSAPGKVILFGEHAVVHGKTAIATALGLRTFVFVQELNSEHVELYLPSLNVTHKWNLTEFDPFLDTDFVKTIKGINSVRIYQIKI